MSQREESENELPRDAREGCPRCGCDVLDGQGPFTRSMGQSRLGGGWTKRFEKWYQLRCGECELVFATRDRVVHREWDRENGELGDIVNA